MIKYKASFIPNNVRDGIADLQMRVRWADGILVFNTGYKISLDKWDKELQQCVNNTTHPGKASAAEINRTIREYKSAALSVFSTSGPGTDKATIRQEINRILGKKQRGAPAPSSQQLIAPAFEQYIIRESAVKSWTDGTVATFRTVMNMLLEWKPGITFAQLDTKGLESYFVHLSDKRSNTIKDRYAKLRKFLKWADKHGYPVNPDYKDFQPRVKTMSKTVVWLAWDEVLRLLNYDVRALSPHNAAKADHCAIARDMLCFSCFTGLRCSDIVSLKWSSIWDGKIHINLRKTTAPVVVELNRYSSMILARYAGLRGIETDENVFPKIAVCTINDLIAFVCKECGFLDTPTAISYYRGSERVNEVHPKHELISMHTGRRSFICNALEKGISPNIIMQWTGHKNYESMRPYISISDKAKETAMKLFDIE